MILPDHMLRRLMEDGLIADPDYGMLNPASIDIRVGKTAKIEVSHGRWLDVEIGEKGLVLDPGDFALVSTWESFKVPNGYAMDLRLKSSTARRGFDHSLAFWVDPGWEGVLTMEIRNVLQYHRLTLFPKHRFAQVLVHQLAAPAETPYDGKYKGAGGVEGPK
jgi:dCTP deaminase